MDRRQTVTKRVIAGMAPARAPPFDHHSERLHILKKRKKERELYD